MFKVSEALRTNDEGKVAEMESGSAYGLLPRYLLWLF